MGLLQLIQRNVREVSNEIPVVLCHAPREPLPYGIDAQVCGCCDDHVRPSSAVPVGDFPEQILHIGSAPMGINVGWFWAGFVSSFGSHAVYVDTHA